MSESPTRVRVRTYNVGFGDCFLLTFIYANQPDQHVLIDFGTMGLPRRADGSKPHGTAEIAQHIADTCQDGRLAAVVATHRHQDHISGFGGSSGGKISALEPELVLQPWTEEPGLEENATAPAPLRRTAGQFGLRETDLAAALDNRGLLYTDQELDDEDFESERIQGEIARYRRERRGTTSDELDEVVFNGNNNISNWSAIQNLTAMAPDDRRKYLKAGNPTGLDAHLPGVKVHVLGPPTVDDDEDVATQATAHKTEFWHLVDDARGVQPLGVDGGSSSRPDPRFPDADPPVDSRWLIRRLNATEPRDLLGIVRDLDDALNNTSLILLFEVWEGDACRRLLFPGDAQIENWQHCLEDDEFKELLAKVDVYKVGHHGSLNATPKISLWENFSKTGPDGIPERLTSVLSTKDGRHGHAKDRTEVPRKTLVEALSTESNLVDTRTLADSSQELFAEFDVTPAS
ncbi:MAG: hypothetical protein GY708_23715 [Actinomycetia bacterium]|nr:hypothetical protein [Actinomycetes bacterium]